tara:strand:- start:197 stop:328 length:132 start_codon:yes stop_codon:yes gene_type:complete
MMPFTESIEFKIEQKFIKNLKKITLKKLNLKMIIQQNYLKNIE